VREKSSAPLVLRHRAAPLRNEQASLPPPELVGPSSSNLLRPSARSVRLCHPPKFSRPRRARRDAPPPGRFKRARVRRMSHAAGRLLAVRPRAFLASLSNLLGLVRVVVDDQFSRRRPSGWSALSWQLRRSRPFFPKKLRPENRHATSAFGERSAAVRVNGEKVPLMLPKKKIHRFSGAPEALCDTSPRCRVNLLPQP